MALNSATNKNGVTVNVNDAVSITAKVVSVSGTGSKATVTVQAPFDASTFNIQANDANAVCHPNDANHAAVGFGGQSYGLAGNDITVLGIVTALAGTGQNSTLTVKLVTSGNTITTAAGNCTSATQVS